MKQRIDLRGIIVGARYDNEWWKPEIDAGFIIPEGRVRKALAAANGDVELYINSQGGDVFAGHEIINAITEFRAKGHKVEIIVGAQAFSMAANIVAMAGAVKVRAHKNAQFIYHGCYTETAGGASAHGDAKKLLDDINANVIAALKAKGIADCDEWFAEGRDHSLSAKEAMELGLVDELIDAEDAKPPKMVKASAVKMMGHWLDVAALEIADVEAGPAPTPDSQRWKDFQASKDREVAAALEKNAALAAQVTDLQAKLAKANTDVEGVTASLTAEKAEHEKTKATLAEKGEQLKRSQANHQKITGGVLGKTNTTQTSITSWQDAVNALGYVKAKQQHPDLLAAFKAAHKNKGN